MIDDLGAILIIAVFYPAEISLGALALAGLAIVTLGVLDLRGVTRIMLNMLVGVALWLFVLKSGVNPTLAGVITALFVPMRGADNRVHPLHDLVGKLKFSVVFLIMPIFAFANAGVPLTGLGLGDMLHPVTSGIALGLLIGKPIGITLLVYIAVRSGLARLPDKSTWLQVVGVAFIAGIGFTMSLFIGVLAFGDGELMNKVRLGVAAGLDTGSARRHSGADCGSPQATAARHVAGLRVLSSGGYPGPRQSHFVVRFGSVCHVV